MEYYNYFVLFLNIFKYEIKTQNLNDLSINKKTQLQNGVICKITL